MAARPNLASPVGTGRTLLALVILGTVITFAWVVATLAVAAFGG